MKNLTEKEKASGKKYMKEFWPPMIAYVVVLLAAQNLLKQYTGTLWEIPLALAPVVPIYFVVRAIVRFIKRMDEFQKRIFMESAAITLLVIIFSAFSYGFLEGQGFPHVDLILAAILSCLLFFVTLTIVRRKYDGE